MTNTYKHIRRLETALDVALKTLKQIATTPRNKGARQNAAATHAFLTTQLQEITRKNGRGDKHEG